MYVKIFC